MKGLISVSRDWFGGLFTPFGSSQLSPFPVGSDAVGMFFLQGCQAALTSPKSSPDNDGVTWLWIHTLPCLWSLSIFHCNAEGHSFSFLTNPLPSPAWPCVYLHLMQTSTCVDSDSHLCIWKEVKNVAHHLSAWAQKSFFSSSGCNGREEDRSYLS